MISALNTLGYKYYFTCENNIGIKKSITWGYPALLKVVPTDYLTGDIKMHIVNVVGFNETKEIFYIWDSKASPGKSKGNYLTVKYSGSYYSPGYEKECTRTTRYVSNFLGEYK